MRHRIKQRSMGRETGHRKATLAAMAAALVKHEQITTTLGKAKALRPYAEKLITLGKKGGLANRRKAVATMQDEAQVAKIFDVLAERYASRPGGYTRIMRAGFRYGDSAPLAVIELVDRDEAVKGLDSGPPQFTGGEDFEAPEEETAGDKPKKKSAPPKGGDKVAPQKGGKGKAGRDTQGPKKGPEVKRKAI